jgi:tetratricopeptide (TPR) repeat protein
MKNFPRGLVVFPIAAMAGGVFAAPALADPCDAVEREMTYGETAVEVAKTQADYRKAAEQFKAAVGKAPKCASAYFNLGLTLEKAEQYLPAKEAYETYLKLAPTANDAAAVRKQIYRLEFLAANSANEPSADAATGKWGHIAGRWRYGEDIYDVKIDGEQIRITMRERVSVVSMNSGGDCTIRSRTNISGRISADGFISGTVENGAYREERRCAAGKAPVKVWNYDRYKATGHVASSGNRIEIQYMQRVLGKNFPAYLKFTRD